MEQKPIQKITTGNISEGIERIDTTKRDSLSEILNTKEKADAFMKELNDLKKKESGFFDLPTKDICNDKEHKPPMYIHIPLGKGYRHICPSCGKETVIIPQQISF